MINIKVENVGPVKQADIQVDGITMVCAPNGGGKTTILQAAAMCACGMSVPTDMQKQHAGLLVRSGEKKGVVSVQLGVDLATLTWPSCKFTSSMPLASSAVVVGMVGWMELPPAAKQEAIGKALAVSGLSTSPTFEDFKIAWDACGIHAMECRQGWDLIVKSGWDNAFQKMSSLWTDRKAVWAHLAGTAWGEQKARSYRHPIFPDGLQGNTVESLTLAVQEAQIARDAAIGHEAVSAEKLAKLQEMAGRPKINVDAEHDRAREIAGLILEIGQEGVEGEEEIEAEIEAAKKRLSETEEAYQRESDLLAAIRQELPELPPILEDEVGDAKCPSCKTMLVIGGEGGDFVTQLAHPRTFSAEEKKRNRQDREAAQKHLDNVTKRLNCQAEELERQMTLELVCKATLEALQASLDKKRKDAEKFQKKRIAELRAEADELRKAIEKADALAAAIEKAKKELASSEEAQKAQEGKQPRAVLEDALVTARRTLEAFKVVEAATATAAEAFDAEKLRTILSPGPEGLRRKKMLEMLGRVNTVMGDFCTLAGWDRVQMDDSLNLVGGELSYPYSRLSGATQWRANLVLQATLARFGAEPILIADRADILDHMPGSRQGMVAILDGLGIPALIGMMATRSYAKECASAVDAVYWLADGVAVQVGNE